jgi:hypothetical protein
MSTPQSPFQDHAAPILQGDPSLSDQARSNLWDIFHGSKDPAELAQKLQNVPHPDDPTQTLRVPDDTKHKLWEAKQASMPVAPPVDKVTEAVQRMVALDPKTLDTAESHPNMLKAFTTAATAPEKAAPAAAGASSAAGKGDTASKAKKPAAAPLPPRPDGQQHFPAIPEGHKRILHSNGGVYDIPEENLEAVRTKDPNMHVLNP